MFKKFKKFLVNCETIILGTGLALVICSLLLVFSRIMFGNGEDLKSQRTDTELLNHTTRMLNLNTVILNSINSRKM